MAGSSPPHPYACPGDAGRGTVAGRPIPGSR